MTVIRDDLALMQGFACDFERRWRDVRNTRNHCVSIEWRYMPECEPMDRPIRVVAPFGEDCYFVALRAWGKLGDDMKGAIRAAYGFGCGSQAEYERKLEQAIHGQGRLVFDKRVDNALLAWCCAMIDECGGDDDFELLFYR